MQSPAHRQPSPFLTPSRKLSRSRASSVSELRHTSSFGSFRIKQDNTKEQNESEKARVINQGSVAKKVQEARQILGDAKANALGVDICCDLECNLVDLLSRASDCEGCIAIGTRILEEGITTTSSQDGRMRQSSAQSAGWKVLSHVIRGLLQNGDVLSALRLLEKHRAEGSERRRGAVWRKSMLPFARRHLA